MHRSLLIAPAFAITFMGLCALTNVGPGAFFLAMVLLFMLVAVQPPLQLVLMRTEKLKSNTWDAWFLSVLGTLLPIGVALAFGVFSFW